MLLDKRLRVPSEDKGAGETVTVVCEACRVGADSLSSGGKAKWEGSFDMVGVVASEVEVLLVVGGFYVYGGVEGAIGKCDVNIQEGGSCG